MSSIVGEGSRLGSYSRPNSRYAWFSDQEFQAKLKALFQGRCESCPAKFFESGGTVLVGTKTTSDHKNHRPPIGYSFHAHFQGAIGQSRGVSPSKTRCEKAVTRYRELLKEGIDSATIKTGWIFGSRIELKTKEGKTHRIAL